MSIKIMESIPKGEYGKALEVINALHLERDSLQSALTALRQRNAELEAQCAAYRRFVFKFSGGSSIHPSLEWARQKADEVLLAPNNEAGRQLVEEITALESSLAKSKTRDEEARWLIERSKCRFVDGVGVMISYDDRRTAYLKEAGE